jgi:hypothetical protein
MIRIVEKDEILGRDDLLGKWVMKASPVAWPSFSSPRIVSAVKGQRLEVEIVQPSMVEGPDGTRLHVFSDETRREPDGQIKLSSVACICDTAADVNVVTEMNRRMAKQYKENLHRQFEKVAALHGTGDPSPPRMVVSGL